MACAILERTSGLEPSSVQYYDRIIQRHTSVFKTCCLWTGQKDKDGYGEISFQFRGKRVKVRVHRLVFYIQTNFTDMKTRHVSHICHKKDCIKFEHLSLETVNVNNKRKRLQFKWRMHRSL